MIYFFNFFLLHRTACGILVPGPGIQPRPLAVESRTPNHWTAREVPDLLFFFFFFFNFFFLNFIYLIYLFLAVLGLSFCARTFSSCGERGHSSSRCAGLSLSRPPLLWSTGSRRAGSAIVAHGPSRSVVRGILPDQGSNPCPLHWQADSQPLRHQGSPYF